MKNDLELNVTNLVESKVLNLEVSLGTFVKAGALAGVDPWDIWCGNGWIVRRKGPGPVRLDEMESFRDLMKGIRQPGK
jgi:hypothetical protein